MKKALIILGVVLAVTALIAFNKMTSKSNKSITYIEVKKGKFEITVSAAGELIAEKSVDIRGPEIGVSNDRGPGRGGPGGGPGGGRGMQGRGTDMHAMDLKIQDIVPEGTIVKEGDYIAQIDRTSYDNTLKDEVDNLTTMETNLKMMILDTAVTLTSLRDDIKNQRFVVEEAKITLDMSKYEPPATIRQAEINLDKAKRNLEQLKKQYELRVAQSKANIAHQRTHVNQKTRTVKDLQEFLAKFTVRAPSAGMIIYKKDRLGNKRKAGSTLNAFDPIIATLPDLSSMISKIYVSEIEVSKVKPDQKVDIKIDAFPDKAFTGSVLTVANIGEQLPNSDAKMFEVQIKINGSDPALRPSMTTSNKIYLKTIDDVVFIPTECVQTGSDSIPFVYEKNKTKQIVLLGEANEKNIIVRKGLEPGNAVYVINPPEPEKFRITGEELIPEIRAKK
jgi:HlyD family secretion protein